MDIFAQAEDGAVEAGLVPCEGEGRAFPVRAALALAIFRKLGAAQLRPLEQEILVGPARREAHALGSGLGSRVEEDRVPLDFLHGDDGLVRRRRGEAAHRERVRLVLGAQEEEEVEARRNEDLPLAFHAALQQGLVEGAFREDELAEEIFEGQEAVGERRGPQAGADDERRSRALVRRRRQGRGQVLDIVHFDEMAALRGVEELGGDQHVGRIGPEHGGLALEERAREREEACHNGRRPEKIR